MAQSARVTAHKEIEIVAYVDSDDMSSLPAIDIAKSKVIVGPRIRTITEYWNRCLSEATGDILLQGNDDCRFLTHGWDTMVEEEFSKYPDRILMVHGSDGGSPVYWNEQFGAHCFVHRRFVEIAGWFIDPSYSSDFGDTTLTDIFSALDRRKYLPFTIEHIHHAFGKAEIDETTRDRLQRHAEDNVDALYWERLPERTRIANLLAKAMVPPHVPVTERDLDTRIRHVGPCPKCQCLSTVKTREGKWCNRCGHSWALA